MLPYNVLRVIEELQNNKADKDLSNTVPSQSFKDMSVSWGMPDYSATIQLSGLEGSFEDNGIFHPRIFVQGPNKTTTVSINGNLAGIIGASENFSMSTTIFIPVSKNDTYSISTTRPDAQVLYFSPFKGGA